MHSNYWQHASELGRTIYNQRPASVDEQAGPAYFAALRLSRWLFWKRLKWAARQIELHAGDTALDFGCGFGLLLPHLRDHFRTVTAVDLVPELATELMERWPQKNSIWGQLEIARSIEEAHIQPGSLDLIVALDVLEHFQSLDAITDQLASLLKPTGRVLVSGPTETWLYRLGRKLVGFSGEYHHQTIYQVHTALEHRFTLQSNTSLPPLCPLFLMSTWKST